LKRQALITGASTALVRAMGFALRLYVSRLLGAEALGVMELASGVHMMALTPAAAGLPQAVSRLTAKAKDREGRERVLFAGRRLALALGLMLTPVYLILSPFLAKWMGDERALPALLLFAPCMLTVGLSSVYDGYFFGQGRALPPAISEGAEQVLRLGAVAALAGLVPLVTPAYRAALPAFASSLGEAAGLLVILPMAGRVASFRRDPKEKEIRKALLRLSLPLLLNRLVHTGLRSVCNAAIPLRLMAGGLDKAEAMSRLGMLGGMVMPLMFLPCMASGALSAIGGPAAARCSTRKAESRLIRKLLLSALAVGAFCAGGLYILSPYIARWVYRLPELTLLLQSACPLAVILPAQQMVGGLMTGLGLQRRSLRASLLGSAALLLCAWQWTPRFGILGTAWAYMAGHGLTLFCELVFLAGRDKMGNKQRSAGDFSSNA
jgi:stage V sporulation protein B